MLPVSEFLSALIDIQRESLVDFLLDLYELSELVIGKVTEVAQRAFEASLLEVPVLRVHFLAFFRELQKIFTRVVLIFDLLHIPFRPELFDVLREIGRAHV